eukprot:2683553-Rhodomonas_salina.2
MRVACCVFSHTVVRVPCFLFRVQCSVFSVQCSVIHARCSGFTVPLTTPKGVGSGPSEADAAALDQEQRVCRSSVWDLVSLPDRVLLVPSSSQPSKVSTRYAAIGRAVLDSV